MSGEFDRFGVNMDIEKSMKFHPIGSSAISEIYGVRVCRPRVLPGRSGNEIELEYAVYINEIRHGLFFLGSFQDDSNGSLALQVTHLGSVPLLDDVLRLKSDVGYKNSDFNFLKEMCTGFVMTYASGFGIGRSTRYLVTIDPKAFREKFPNDSVGLPVDEFRNVILSMFDLHVSARGD